VFSFLSFALFYLQSKGLTAMGAPEIWSLPNVIVGGIEHADHLIRKSEGMTLQISDFSDNGLNLWLNIEKEITLFPGESIAFSYDLADCHTDYKHSYSPLDISDESKEKLIACWVKEFSLTRRQCLSLLECEFEDE
jgi:hypothetical protein